MSDNEAKHRGRRWAGHPLVVGMFLVLLGIDFVSINPGDRDYSAAYRLVFGSPRVSGYHGAVPGVAVKEDGKIAWRWIWELPDDESRWNTPGALSDVIVFRHPYRDKGMYHLTRRTSEVWVGTGLALEDSIRREVMDAVVDAIDRVPPDMVPGNELITSLFRDGVTRRETPIVTGYIRNAIAITLALITLICIIHGKTWRWLPNPRDWVERKRTAEGRCSHCGYDLEGLARPNARQVKCPECGQHMPIVARDQPD